MNCNYIPISVKVLKKQTGPVVISVYTEIKVHCIGFIKHPGQEKWDAAWHTDATCVMNPTTEPGPLIASLILSKYMFLLQAMPAIYRKSHQVPYKDLMLGASLIGALVTSEEQ